MHTGHVQQGKNTSSFASSSAVSGGRHLLALHAQTGESGVLAGGNCQPNAALLDMFDLFQGTAQSHRMFSVQLTEIVVRVQLLRHGVIKKVIVINCNLITFSKIIECNCN